jgi:uronate dehydrogenase
MTAVVHLAAVPNDAPMETLVGPNILGVHHLLEAAREHGVGRVILASSIQVVGRPAPGRKVTSADREPHNLYALTKLWAEELGGMYARVHGMSVIAARIGWMVRNEGEASHMRDKAWFHAYLSRGDIASFFALAVETKEVPFSVMYVVGPEGADRFDLEPARRLLGWTPRDIFPQGLPFPAQR